MIGYYKGTTNQELINIFQKQYIKQKQKNNITTEYIPGHSNNKWNDLADKLANQGREGETPPNNYTLEENEGKKSGNAKYVTRNKTL